MTVMDSLPDLFSQPAAVLLEMLVRRHVDMVYAAALRQVRDPHLAADVTQAVFLVLQRKLGEGVGGGEGRLGPGTILSAWLLRTTHYACLTALRRQRRRSIHEQKAAIMHAKRMEQPESEWSDLIDRSVDQLGARDRAAITGVYFEGLTHKELASRLGVSEQAAHKRVQRALEKLRGLLVKGGVRMPAAGVAGALMGIGKPAAAPVAVSRSVLLCIGGKTPAAVQGIAKGTMFMMQVLQVKVAGVLALAAAGVVLGAAVLGPAWGQGVQVPAATPVAIAVAPAEGDGAFRPEMTLTIYDDGSATPTVMRDFVADLDTGKSFTPPRDSDHGPFGVSGWIERQGGDVLYESATSVRALMGFDLAICPAEGMYEQIDAPMLLRQLIASTPATPAVMSVRELPATFAFRTREGGVGVLQVVKVDANPSSATVRYKLLTEAARDKAAADLVLRMVMPEMEKLAAQLATGQDPAEQRATVRGVARGAVAMMELMKGTPARLAVMRRLGTPVRIMSERVDDGQADKVKESVGDLQRALEAVKVEAEAMKRAGQ